MARSLAVPCCGLTDWSVEWLQTAYLDLDLPSGCQGLCKLAIVRGSGKTGFPHGLNLSLTQALGASLEILGVLLCERLQLQADHTGYGKAAEWAPSLHKAPTGRLPFFHGCK